MRFTGNIGWIGLPLRRLGSELAFVPDAKMRSRQIGKVGTVATALGLSLCGRAEIPQAVATDSYDLIYATKRTSIPTRGKVVRGQYELIEKEGKLLARYVDPERSAKVLFDGHETLSIGNVGAFFQTGLEVPGPNLDVYLPQHFHCQRTFIPFEEFLAAYKLTEAQKQLLRSRGASLGVLVGWHDGKDVFSAGRFTPKSTSRGDTQELIVGFPDAPHLLFEYSEFRPVDGMSIPGRIELVRSRPKQPSEPCTPYEKVEFRLIRATAPTNASLPLPEALLTPGMLVSAWTDHGHVGVIYDPQKGSFQEQLESELAQFPADKAPIRPLPQPAPSRFSAWMAGGGTLGLTIGLGWLFMRRRRKAG